MAQKISQYLLISLILTLGFGQLLRFEVGSLTIYLHDVLVLLLLVANTSSLYKIKLPSGIKLFLFGLGLGWLNALLHCPISLLLLPSLYTFRLLAYLALYFVIRDSKLVSNQHLFISSGLISLSLGLIQYSLLPDMRWAQYLGWDDHLNRLTLPHFDPTFSAIMLGLLLLVLIKNNSRLLSLFCFTGILLSYSRSVWLSLALVGLWYGLAHRKFIKVLLYCAIFTIALLFLPRRFGEGNNLLRTFSLNSRWQADLGYVQQYRWDLIVGRGMNTLSLEQSPSLYSNHATSPNNSYLYLLVTTGVIGLIGWGKFIYSLYQQSANKPMLLFFFIASLFNNVMFYPFALLWVFLVETQSNI